MLRPTYLLTVASFLFIPSLHATDSSHSGTPQTGDHKVATLQEELGGINAVNLQGELDATGKLQVKILQGTDLSGKLIATTSPSFVYSGPNGKRLEFGGDPSLLDVLYTPGESDGAAVLYFRKNGQLGKGIFACAMQEKKGKLVSFHCHQVFHKDGGDETTLVSPIKSTLPEVDIANAHGVGPKVNGKFPVIRGMSPRKKTPPGQPEDLSGYESVKKYGVKRVLIFKNAFVPPSKEGKPPEKDENEKEKDIWTSLGVESEIIPFPWENLPKDQVLPCQQTIQALQFILKNRDEGVFFHCTVGEDRTGYLAGLYRLLTEGGDPYKMFTEELCENGYEKGDAGKPFEDVDQPIRDSLTKMYIQMAYKISNGSLTPASLNDSVCRQFADLDKIGAANQSLDYNRYKCFPSTRFRALP